MRGNNMEDKEHLNQVNVHVLNAILEAARFCDEPANRETVAETLARPGCVGADADAIQQSMRSVYDFGNGRIEPCQGFNIFARENASEPDERKAVWVAQSLVSSGLATAAQLPLEHGVKTFRSDLVARASVLAQAGPLATPGLISTAA